MILVDALSWLRIMRRRLLRNNNSVPQITYGRRQIRAIGRPRLRSRIWNERKLRDAVSCVSILHLWHGFLTDFVPEILSQTAWRGRHDDHTSNGDRLVLRPWRSFSGGWTIFLPWHLPWLRVCYSATNIGLRLLIKRVDHRMDGFIAKLQTFRTPSRLKICFFFIHSALFPREKI